MAPYHRGVLTQQTDVLSWEVERQGLTAVVREDGLVESSDPHFADYLRQRLSEPVTVWRRGTLRQTLTTSGDSMSLRPGDGRYVVARMRSLAAEDDGVRILRIVWNQ